MEFENIYNLFLIFFRILLAMYFVNNACAYENNNSNNKNNKKNISQFLSLAKNTLGQGGYE